MAPKRRASPMRKSPSNHKSHTNVKSKSSVMSLATPQVEDKQKHVRVKKYMFKKPEPLNTWGDEEHRSESWMELFIDLFYVAFFIKLGDVFYTCGFNVDSMMYVASVFLGIYMSKFDFDQYMNKFEGEDLVHKFFFLFYSLGNVIMILNVNETSEHAPSEDDGYDGRRFLAAKSDRHVTCVAYEPYSFGFTVGWLVTRGSIFVMYCLIAHHVKPQGEYLFKSKSPILISSMLIICVNFFVDGGGNNYTHTYVILIAGCVEFFGWMIWEVFVFGSCIVKYVGRHVLIPVNIHHITSRTSTFIMLVLGEAVIALLTPTFKGAGNHYFFAVFGVMIIFVFTFLYFDMQPQQHEPNALTLGRASGVVWLALHPMLAFSMFGIGMSLKLLYADLKEHKDPDFSEQLLGGFLGTSVILMTFIRASHKEKYTKERLITFTIRLIMASLHFEVGYIKLISKNINVTVGLHIVICFLLIAIDTWKYRHIDLSSQKSPPSGPSIGGVVGGSMKSTPRRSSVYAPQQSATRSGINVRSSMRHSAVFTQNPSLFMGLGNSDSTARNVTGQPPEIRRSKSAGLDSNHSDGDTGHRDMRRVGSMNDADNKVRELVRDFEKARPRASVKEVRSLLKAGSRTPKSFRDATERKEGGVDNCGLEMAAVAKDKPVVPDREELGTVVISNEDKLQGEERDDDYIVEYVCYVDENGDFIEIDKGMEVNEMESESNFSVSDYEDEIIEVVYDVDGEVDEFDDYTDDEIEVIYEDPDPPKSHITWL